jgi:hypothetical protein
MQRTALAIPPLRGRQRLGLAPRLRADETISSWLERLAGAYGMTTIELMRWLGYRTACSYSGVSILDLDVCPPPDLSSVLAQHTAVSAAQIDGHRLPALGLLSPERRRAFCPTCWSEQGPYRRREWTHSLSLICLRHRQLLAEKPQPQPPFERGYQESWLEFYESPHQWRDTLPAWETQRWTKICAALEVDPRSEFLSAWRWLRELQTLTPEGRAVATARSSYADLSARRDLVLFALMEFHERSLLRALDPSILRRQLIQDRGSGEQCTAVWPDADYEVRLFATVVARHLWVRLTEGRWCSGRHREFEEFLTEPRRWNIEDWWLEKRIRSWPTHLHPCARRLFNKEDPWVQLPPWPGCQARCVRKEEGVVRGGMHVMLPPNWRCKSMEAWHPSSRFR